MTSVVEGEEVEENFITDYSNLGELLEKVNKILPEAKKLDKERHVRVRDAFAHGRLLSETPDGVPTLVKFSKGHDRRVRVEFAQKLSDEWLAAEINFVGDSVRTIHEHLSSTSGPT